MLEVLQGFRSDKDFKTVKGLLAEFDEVQLLGHDRAAAAAIKYRTLRKSGVTIRKAVDVVIASYCIDEQVALLYSDKDFNPFVAKLGMESALIL